jgi:hypothetical protein
MLRELTFTAIIAVAAHGDDTVGVLIKEPGCTPGYNLFSQLQSTETFLIDNDGRLVNSWSSSYVPGNSCYLLESGDLLRSADMGSHPLLNNGGNGGIVERFDWDGTLEWTYIAWDATSRQHHDIEYLPNGDVLMIQWEFKTQAEALDMGRTPGTVLASGFWSEKIIQVRPNGTTGGTIVWEWHVWDHLIQNRDASYGAPFGEPSDNPTKININYPQTSNNDWLHINSIDYNAELDQIVVSVHNTNEIWIINHAIDTEAAAGDAGDLMYRWGNGRAYGRGPASNQRFFGQHDARWITDCGCADRDGNIMVFNNGAGRPGADYSTVEEITPPLHADDTYSIPATAPFPPTSSTIVYQAAPDPTAFNSGFISGAEPLGENTLICSGAWGTFFEVDAASEIVWLYVNPIIGDGVVQQGDAVPGGPNSSQNSTFRCSRYLEDFPGFFGRDMTPGSVLEGSNCIGDIDGNGVVDGGDLGLLLAAWSTPDAAADLDGSGAVNGADLGLLLAGFGPCM